jgi:alkylhydroperoxidase/carboxymuconolactone decarboxylase family protein YurZ
MKRDLPSGAGRLADRHPKVWAAYEHLGEAVAEGGPLDAKTRRLVKLALAIGCSSEGAVHSHARRAVSEGVKPDELRHVILLGRIQVPKETPEPFPACSALAALSSRASKTSSGVA